MPIAGQVKYYRPDSLSSRQGHRIVAGMVDELTGSRELLWRMIVREIKAKYRQSLLGWLWLVLSPILTMGVFGVLANSGIMDIGTNEVPFLVYGWLSIMVWNVFATGWSKSTTALTRASSLVSKINFPKVVLIVVAMAEASFEFLVRWILLFPIFAWTLGYFEWRLLLLPMFLLPVIFLSTGLGLLSSLMHAVVRDTAEIINFLLGLLIFATPVLYEKKQEGLLATVNAYNPMAYLIDGVKNWVWMSEFPGTSWWMVSFGALVLLIAGWWIFYLSQVKLAERV